MEVTYMPEKCPHCGREFINTKALGSHIHYVHENESWASITQNRSESEKERFQKLFCSSLPDKNLRCPRKLDKIEQAISEIPEGVSDTVDRYREAYRRATRKEELLKEIEEDLQREESAGETK